jgi:protein required for attachment to host cells
MKQKNLRIWVIVTDSARAHLFTYDERSEQLRSAELAGLPEPDELIGSHATKSDRPGRTFGSGGDGTRHVIESHSDFRKLEKQRFTIAVADAVNRAASADEFDRLILIAPDRSIGELRKHLSDRVQSTMETVHKDLTKTPVEKIGDEVAETVRKSRRMQAR